MDLIQEMIKCHLIIFVFLKHRTQPNLIDNVPPISQNQQTCITYIIITMFFSIDSLRKHQGNNTLHIIVLSKFLKKFSIIKSSIRKEFQYQINIVGGDV